MRGFGLPSEAGQIEAILGVGVGIGADLDTEVHWFIMISNDDTDCDPDTDPDPEDSSLLFLGYNDTRGSPERLGFSGLNGRRPCL